MRVLLDTNLYVSYLLTPESESPAIRVLEAAVAGEFTLLLPEAVLDELAARVEEKPYLASRISPEELATLAEIVRSVAEIIPRIEEAIPAVTRDPKDDYLLAYAMVGRADYLVTGDRDLLALRQVDGVNVVTARRFLEFLEA